MIHRRHVDCSPVVATSVGFFVGESAMTSRRARAKKSFLADANVKMRIVGPGQSCGDYTTVNHHTEINAAVTKMECQREFKILFKLVD